MEDQRGVDKKGGTMRLGAYPCKLKKGLKSHKAYGCLEVSERHRHRYEFNNSFRTQLTDAGLEFSGLSPDSSLVEIIELPEHPWFVGCQFHPEFKSKPTAPHPLFKGFVKAVLTEKQAKKKKQTGPAKKRRRAAKSDKSSSKLSRAAKGL